MIKEVIIVEGKSDTAVVSRAVDAEIIETGGFALSPRTMERIAQAYDKRGIIILTDPDSAGEHIRRFLAERFPEAKHAFVSRAEATANDDIGIEQASLDAVRQSLAKVRYREWEPQQLFSIRDILVNNLSGTAMASERRAAVGDILGIGYANAKQFLLRLNNYGVTREEFAAAIAKLDAEGEKA